VFLLALTLFFMQSGNYAGVLEISGNGVGFRSLEGSAAVGTSPLVSPST
jgi:hypothetical protein